MKAYLYAALAIAIAGIWYYSIYIERQAWQDKMDKAALVYEKKQADLVGELGNLKAAHLKVSQDRQRIIDDAKKAPGCINTRIPQPLLDSLHNDSPNR